MQPEVHVKVQTVWVEHPDSGKIFSYEAIQPRSPTTTRSEYAMALCEQLGDQLFAHRAEAWWSRSHYHVKCGNEPVPPQWLVWLEFTCKIIPTPECMVLFFSTRRKDRPLRVMYCMCVDPRFLNASLVNAHHVLLSHFGYHDGKDELLSHWDIMASVRSKLEPTDKYELLSSTRVKSFLRNSIQRFESK